MKSWDKFRLLLWKNWKLQLRKPISFALEIGIPVLAIGAFLLMRYYVTNNDIPVQKYVEQNLLFNGYGFIDMPYLDSNYSAYCPNSNKFVKNLMSKYSNMQGFSKCTEMEDYFKNLPDGEVLYSNHIGIQFDEDLPDDVNKVSGKLNIRLRYESMYRSWYTESIYPGFQVKSGPRSSGFGNGGPPDYHSDYFDQIMYNLTNEILKAKGLNMLETMYLKRFPDQAFVRNQLIETCGTVFLFGFLFMAAFTYACGNTVKAITLEKERQLKESMKIMGLPTWLHWTAWFFQIFVPLFFSLIIITVGFKIETRYGSILPFSDWSLIFVFLLLYVTAMITFSFALSVFFSNANRAASLAGVIWILSMIPYMIVRSGDYSNIEPTTKYMTSSLIVSAMFYGFDIITLYESQERGINWNNLFETTRQDNLSFGGILIMMFVDIFIYLAIALYIEQIFPGKYGVPQKWYFLFTPEFWGKKSNPSEKTLLNNISGEYFENEPTNLKVGIEIKNLGKTFGANDAVKGISLNLYEDQITVLLGHNGAGKTTTMSMLTGMFPPTKGTAFINGYDVRTQIMSVRDSMGLCPQHNVLFDDLTVREHLQFFSRLKGCKGPEVDEEVKKFLELLSLQDKADALSTALSGGMKRKLCVGIAICGNSKVIMLDEPTAGMDPSARRFIWEFLQKMKKGRTILLTTHFMDEADLLGDRIAIMSGGEVKCCGSSFFLKKKYGTGYHLIIDQLPYCQPNNITKMFRKYIPDVEIESNAGTELTYLLPENYASKFPEMLSEMESRLENLGIRSFGISLTDLEEVFMKVGTNETGKTILKHDDEVRGYTNVTVTAPVNLETGSQLCINQIYAMLIKKSISFVRSWGFELMKIVLPVIYILLVTYAGNTGTEVVNRQSRNFTLGDYDNPITLIEKLDNNIYYENYIKMLEEYNYTYEFTDDMEKTVLNLAKTDPNLLKYRYIVGASFEKDSSIAWFNNEPYHSVPLTVQLLMNAYVKHQTGIQLNFINYPLPKKTTEQDQKIRDYINSGNTIMSMCLAAAFIGTFYIIFNIKERISQAKHLQFVSGINVFIFWGVSFVTDLISYLIPVGAIIVTYSILQPQGLSDFTSISELALLLFNFGVANLPFIYVFSFFFTIPATGYARIYLLGFIAGYPATSIITILIATDWDYVGLTKWILRLLPHYDFIEGVTNIVKRDACKDTFKSCPNMPPAMCKALICADASDNICCEDIFEFGDKGLLTGFVMTYLVALICFAILFLVDLKIISEIKYKLFSNKITPQQKTTTDEDVERENEKVRTTPLAHLQGQYTLILKDLTKNFKDFIAVNGLNLTVKKSECFGLLGVNGAGKTTTFKMMTGDEMISYGDGWVDGFSIKNQMKQVQNLIGYCPQFDALLDNLTARETLKIFSLIRGVPRDECYYMAEKLARDFDFTEHLDKQVRELSGGNKRKLSTSIALIGDAPIIFLDEPTTGMDPATKRHLWNRLAKIRESGKSIILTSHSMEECEALCTRLAIMVNGNFQCLGSTQHLKSRFAEGFSITLKIRKLENSSGNEHADTAQIEQFMKRHFVNAELREKHQELLNYFIKDRNTRWSSLFGILEKSKKELNIEDYSVGQASLEQVFLTFTRNQITNEETQKTKKKCCNMFNCCRRGSK